MGQPTVTKGPERASSGGIAFQPRRNAMLSLLAEALSRLEARKPRGLGYPVCCGGVLGGFAWTKWLTTTTGECPTSSDATAHTDAAVGKAHKASPKRPTDAMAQRTFPKGLCLRDCSNPGVADLPPGSGERENQRKVIL